MASFLTQEEEQEVCDQRVTTATQEHECTWPTLLCLLSGQMANFISYIQYHSLGKHWKISHHVGYKPGLLETMLWSTSCHNLSSDMVFKIIDSIVLYTLND